jgi:hypothetical protein
MMRKVHWILATVLLLLVTRQGRSDFYKLDPQATYLHTYDDYATAPAIIDLSSLSFVVSPGDLIHLTVAGGFSLNGGVGDNHTQTAAVFSSTAILLDSSQADRIPDALFPAFVIQPEAYPFVTPPTYYWGQATDIPQDFAISTGQTFNGVTVQVPNKAKYLFIAAIDDYYADNSDPNGDYGVNISPVTVATPAPPGITLAGVGAFCLASYAWRLRKSRTGIFNYADAQVKLMAAGIRGFIAQNWSRAVKPLWNHCGLAVSNSVMPKGVEHRVKHAHFLRDIAGGQSPNSHESEKFPAGEGG